MVGRIQRRKERVVFCFFVLQWKGGDGRKLVKSLKMSQNF